MPFKRAQVPSQREILSLAEDWGKVVARRAFGDEGPDLDLNFDAIEAVAFQAAQAVIKGTIQPSISATPPPLRVELTCTIRLPANRWANRRSRSTSKWPTISS